VSNKCGGGKFVYVLCRLAPESRAPKPAAFRRLTLCLTRKNQFHSRLAGYQERRHTIIVTNRKARLERRPNDLYFKG